MKKIRLIMLFGIAVLLSLAMASAETKISIDMKDSFSLNDEIELTGSIYSDAAGEIRYYTMISCSEFTSLSDMQTASLESNAEYKFRQSYGKVTSGMNPQQCKAVVNIINPFEISEEKSFGIVTEPSLEFNLLICKDAGCSEESKIFKQSEKVYLNYNSFVQNPEIDANLIYPDGTIKKLILPSSLDAEKIGAYELEVNASKSGYKTASQTEQFAVISGDAVIISESGCNANSICESNENSKTCPQDCVGVAAPNEDKTLLLIILIIAVILIILIIFLIKKRRKIIHKK